MKKKNHDGIVFDNTIYLSEESYKKFPIYMRLLQAFAVFIGSYCFMSIFIRCFSLQVINNNLAAAIALSGGVLYLLILYPAYDLMKIMLSSAIYGWVIYYRYEQLRNGFFLLENAIIKRASMYYGFAEFRFVADQKSVDKDITFLLIMLVIPIVAILTIALLRNKLKLLCYIILLIPAIGSFAMGITPPEADFITLILIMLFLAISNSNTLGAVHKSMIYRISIRAAALFCLLTLLLFFIIKQFVPAESYKDYDGIHVAKTKLQNFMMDFSLQDVSDKLADIRLNIRTNRVESSGGLSLGELGRVDQVTYDETEHLQVTAPLKSVIEGIYLKGYIGSVYTGDSWKTHSKQTIESYNEMITGISGEEFEPAIGSTIFLSRLYRLFVKQGRIGVTYLKADKNYVYTPYFTDFKAKDDVRFEYDLAVMSDKDMKVGTFDYIYNLSNLLDDMNGGFSTSYPGFSNNRIVIELGRDQEDALLQYIKNEREYRQFVYDTYTKLPEEGLDRLKEEFSREKVGKASENLKDAIIYIKDYLNSFTRYTLAPGRLPKDKDFVEYFLYDNKLGYCSHFASAGALMLRAMGYPARYVEGYAINRSDLLDSEYLYIDEREGENSTVAITVKDYNAHAWVEVYYDGLGWIPIEFTTGSGMEDMAHTIDNMAPIIQDEGNEEPTVTPAEPSPSPTVLPEEELQPSPPVQEIDEEDLKSGNSLDKDAKSGSDFGWYLRAALVIIALSGIALYICYYRKMSKKTSEESHSSKALRLYKEIEQLFVLGRGFQGKSKNLEENEEYIKRNLTVVSVKDFERCMDTVRKARFGKEPISPMEYMIVEHFYTNLWNRIYERLPRRKKIYMIFKNRLIFGKNITI